MVVAKLIPGGGSKVVLWTSDNSGEAWEEKHVSIDLEFAVFSVVGGRDQPQLPNPGVFIGESGRTCQRSTKGWRHPRVSERHQPGQCRPAVRAVKETKRTLSIIFRQRKSAYPIVMGIVQSVNSVPHPPPPQVAVVNTETLEYSLYVTSKRPLMWFNEPLSEAMAQRRTSFTNYKPQSRETYRSPDSIKGLFL